MQYLQGRRLTAALGYLTIFSTMLVLKRVWKQECLLNDTFFSYHFPPGPVMCCCFPPFAKFSFVKCLLTVLVIEWFSSQS